MILSDKSILRKTKKIITRDKNLSSKEKDKRIKVVEDIIKIKDIENNSVSYDVLVVCSLEYDINETTSVSNVINNFTLEYKSDKIIMVI